MIDNARRARWRQQVHDALDAFLAARDGSSIAPARATKVATAQEENRDRGRHGAFVQVQSSATPMPARAPTPLPTERTTQ